MKPIAISLLYVSVLVFASRAQTPPQPKKPADEPKLQKPQDKKKAEPEQDGEEAKIFDRLTKNSKKAEEKIGKPDLGDETRQLEKDILKDIEELIKRMQQPPQNSQTSDSSQSDSSSSSSSSDSSSSSSRGSSGSQSSSQPQGGQKSGASGLSRQEQREQRRQQQGKGSAGSKREKSNGGTSMAQNTGNPKAGSGKPMPMNSGNPMKPDNNSQANAGGPSSPKSLPSDSPPTGMYKDVWGHLPEKMRQEMDAYFKERFMPRYSDLLKEYYSTISEQGKK
ncbi:MAG TPA: hypothetical protein VKS79_12230 [Gemmataceae bacterium]|nr:hypothetical protein [Gemmataceae bacterium]